MKFSQSAALILALFLADSQAIKIDELSQMNKFNEDTQSAVENAVKDVLKISKLKEPFEDNSVVVNHHHHHVTTAAPRVVYVPTPVPVYQSPPPQNAPNSGVMRAVAAANEQSALDKVNEQRGVANKLEKIEDQSKINESINQSVKLEEQRVIDEANKRMAEVHSRKAREAAQAAKKIEEARIARKKKEEAARKEEEAAINSVIKTHSGNVVK